MAIKAVARFDTFRFFRSFLAFLLFFAFIISVLTLFLTLITLLTLSTDVSAEKFTCVPLGLCGYYPSMVAMRGNKTGMR